jgi:hypothetical protein
VLGASPGPVQLGLEEREAGPHVLEQLLAGVQRGRLGPSLAGGGPSDGGGGGALLPRRDPPAHVDDGLHQPGVAAHQSLEPLERNVGIHLSLLVGLEERPLA